MPTGRIALLVLVVIVVAAGGSALAGSAQTPARDTPRGTFADRLAAELSLPAAQVREALQAVRKHLRAQRVESRAERRKLRAERRSDRRKLRAERRSDRRKLRAERRSDRRKLRAERRSDRRKARAERRTLRGRRPAVRAVRRFVRLRERFAGALAVQLGVDATKVTAALRTLLAERLDRAVSRGRLTAAGRAAVLACFDDRSRCQGLRAQLRHP